MVEVEKQENENFEIRSGMAFLKLVCLRCGTAIIKSALYDPNLCRQCEKEVEPQERFAS
ncbi:hypothetical protein KY339_06100 [Candidatus Woesearchaeota archaeon]|nr:hypothetical protein [Candidatus Woesearchaeota archaeon]